MTDSSSDILSSTPRQVCECYKKLRSYGIPLYIKDENDFYSEHPKVITYENAYKLPGYLKINENITEYPNVQEKDLSFVFQQMAQVIPNLSDFEHNIFSFWILDIVIEGLWTSQNAKMNFLHQKATLLWIAYFFNYIQKQNPSRQELFKHLKLILFESEYTDSNENFEERSGEFRRKSSSSNQSRISSCNLENFKTWLLPLPPDYNKDNETLDEKPFLEENSATTTEDGSDSNSNDESATETNLNNLKIILEILYRIFARLWVYLEIQTVFFAMPPVEQLDLPFTLNVPKSLLKQEPPILLKNDKFSKRLSFLEKTQEEAEPTRQLQKNDFILPLQSAEESKAYMRQFFPRPSSQRSVLDKFKEGKK